MKGATARWLEHQHTDDEWMQQTGLGLLHLSLEQEEPECPEAYSMLIMMENLHSLYHDGGIADQPFFLTQEINACSQARSDFYERRAANLRIRNKYREEKSRQKAQ